MRPSRASDLLAGWTHTRLRRQVRSGPASFSVVLGFGVLTLALGAATAQAQTSVSKCSAAKIKCVNTKATALLGCHNKAETKGLAIDPTCVTKADTKFTGGGKGCVDKANAKPPCTTTADTTTLENKVDAFVLDVVTELDPTYPTPATSKCSAGKKKCVANKVKAILTCYNKAVERTWPSTPTALRRPKRSMTAAPIRRRVASRSSRRRLRTTVSPRATVPRSRPRSTRSGSTYLGELPAVPLLLDFTTGLRAGPAATCEAATTPSSRISPAAASTLAAATRPCRKARRRTARQTASRWVAPAPCPDRPVRSGRRIRLPPSTPPIPIVRRRAATSARPWRFRTLPFHPHHLRPEHLRTERERLDRPAHRQCVDVCQPQFRYLPDREPRTALSGVPIGRRTGRSAARPAPRRVHATAARGRAWRAHPPTRPA